MSEEDAMYAEIQTLRARCNDWRKLAERADAERDALKAKLEAANADLEEVKSVAWQEKTWREKAEARVRELENSGYVGAWISQCKLAQSECARLREALETWDKWFCAQEYHRRDGINDEHPLAVGRAALQSTPTPSLRDEAKDAGTHACHYFGEELYTPSSRLCLECCKVMDKSRDKAKAEAFEEAAKIVSGYGSVQGDDIFLAEKDLLREAARLRGVGKEARGEKEVG